MNIFKRTKDIGLTTSELALTALDQVQEDIADLRLDAAQARTCLRCAADRLSDVNAALGEKAALCGSLIAQLQSASEDIGKQTEANAALHDQVMALLGLA